MKTITLSAKFTGGLIVLAEDYPIPDQTELLVTILPSSGSREEPDEFRKDWTTLGLASLARAYGEDEPDYPDALIKEPNPEYGKR